MKETDPRHNDEHAARDVDGDEVIRELPLEHQVHGQAAVLSWGRIIIELFSICVLCLVLEHKEECFHFVFQIFVTCVGFHIAIAARVVLNVEPVFNPLREMSQNNIRNNYKPWQIQIVWQLQRVVGVPLVADVIRGVTVWKCFYQIDDFNHFVSIVIIVFIDAG